MDTIFTALSAALSLLGAWTLGPMLGRWAAAHRLARFVVGLLTELRMLPVLVAVVPLAELRFGFPAFTVVGLLGAASRTAAVARIVARSESAPRHVQPSHGRFRQLDRPHGAARAALLLVVPEIALLEGLRTFFSEGRGEGLGAALARGQLLAVVPLLALALGCVLLLERPVLRATAAVPR